VSRRASQTPSVGAAFSVLLFRLSFEEIQDLIGKRCIKVISNLDGGIFFLSRFFTRFFMASF
jgi:hypothetical protein